LLITDHTIVSGGGVWSENPGDDAPLRLFWRWVAREITRQARFCCQTGANINIRALSKSARGVRGHRKGQK